VIEPFFVSENEKISLLKMDLIEIGNTSLWIFDFNTRTFYEYENHEKFDVARKIIKLPKKLAKNEKELKEFLYNMFRDKRIINSMMRFILAPIISNLRYTHRIRHRTTHH